MNAKELIELYKTEKRTRQIKSSEHFRYFVENKVGRPMDRPLFIALGHGGGQTYKTLWEVFDVRGNAGRPCYFYNENAKAVKILTEWGHVPLQEWLDKWTH